jgi:hypothetical protein
MLSKRLGRRMMAWDVAELVFMCSKCYSVHY